MTTATELRDRAMATVGPDAVEWKQKAYEAIRTLAASRRYIHSDDIWNALDEMEVAPPRERRSMGPVISKAIQERIIVSTGKYMPSGRPESHANPKPIYVSLMSK